VGVANIARFVPQLRWLPGWVTPGERGVGFAEVADALLAARAGAAAQPAMPSATPSAAAPAAPTAAPPATPPAASRPT